MEKDTFHTLTDKLLYIIKKARPNIETAVAYIHIRVTKSDVDDWKKLQRVLAWLKTTINYARIILATGFMDLHTWVDAAYAVHSNMRSQSGG